MTEPANFKAALTGDRRVVKILPSKATLNPTGRRTSLLHWSTVVLLLSRRYLIALPLATVVAALLIGIPTDVLPNPWFTRMTPVRPLDMVLWPLTSLAVGALMATFLLPSTQGGTHELSAGAGGGLLSAFAVGCPVCNKVVVLALGFSGALTYFAPVQPLLGAAAMLLTLVALRRRLRQLSGACASRSALARPASR